MDRFPNQLVSQVNCQVTAALGLVARADSLRLPACWFTVVRLVSLFN